MKIGLFWWEVILDLDNGLVPNRRQAIIWTRYDPVQRRIYAVLGAHDLKRLTARFCIAQTYEISI